MFMLGMEQTINLTVLSARHILDDISFAGEDVLDFSYYREMAESVYEAACAAMKISRELGNWETHDILWNLCDQLQEKVLHRKV